MGQGRQSKEEKFWRELLRAYAGGLFVGLPLLMTMEMWQLAYSADRLRVALLLGVNLLLLIGLSFYVGLSPSYGLRHAVADALIESGVGLTVSAVILPCLGALHPQTPLDEAVAAVALLSVPTSIGASVARSQLGGTPEDEAEKRDHAGFFGEHFFGLAGAVFFSFNIAPTEEVGRIAGRIGGWQCLAMICLSLFLLHAFVYAAHFHGQAARADDVSVLSELWRYPVVSYALAFLSSAYLLWTFGRFDDVALSFTGVQSILAPTVVLALPASLGSAAGRLVL